MGFDKSKPHGIVCGDHPARYVQDGVHYDGFGNEVTEEQIRAYEQEKRQGAGAAGPAPASSGVDPAAFGVLQEQLKTVAADLDETRALLAETRGLVDEQTATIALLRTQVMDLSDKAFGVAAPPAAPSADAPAPAAGKK